MSYATFGFEPESAFSPADVIHRPTILDRSRRIAREKFPGKNVSCRRAARGREIELQAIYPRSQSRVQPTWHIYHVKECQAFESINSRIQPVRD